MSSEVLFSSVLFERYDPDQTLPAKFGRLLDALDLEPMMSGKVVAIKMHLGRNIGFSTIHPIYVRALVDKLKSYKPSKLFITDQETEGASIRGYTEAVLGAPIVDACGATERYFYEKKVAFESFVNLDIAGHIHDADVLVDLSHVKGHGCCGYGGAVKNLSMGCVTTRTRQQLHGLEGGITWDSDLCTRCQECVKNCNHNANCFNGDNYEVNFHDCTFCQHCVKVCPTDAIKMTDSRYEEFQTGMALAAKGVLDTFAPENMVFINFLNHITVLCDCWGLTTPSLVPDIGVLASRDIVAVERASMDMIKLENLIRDGLPAGMELTGHGHLFEQIHGKDPYIQLEKLIELGVGSQEYQIREIK